MDLRKSLEQQTQNLLQKFLERTTEYATHYYELMKKRNDWKEKDWCEHYGLIPEVKVHGNITFHKFPNGFYNSPISRVYSKDWREVSIFNYKFKTFESYLAKEIELANRHYQYSLDKLVFRLVKKGVTTDDFSITNESIGVNINLNILHADGKLTKACTIIAEGEIQRPHYRFLIK